jgi:large subunit ribosomal protein L23
VIKEAYQTIRRPRITEKTTRLRKKAVRLYVFEVDPALNKLEIKAAVEQLFRVKVESVRTQNVRGKWKRVGRSLGKRSDWKKAYVQVREGEKPIEFFEGS